ncbi:oxidase [Roseomonas nepalensis]|uniref:Oxidase n=1 Tax=Muricoccus nepalensis TaxID=1854500 RepID=A0A502FW63_9PROT|nr:cytochrome C oxidase subunit IV family protein [Roseomonas nepalensis]TPG53173.1 oxidase [Roseomonas nepalensis]
MNGLGENLPQDGAAIWRRNLPIWAVLVGLVVATLLLAYVPLGRWNTPISLGIGAAKAVLIAVCFMNLRRPDPLLRLTGSASLLWIAFLFALTLADVLTRAPTTQPGTVEPRTEPAVPNPDARLF